MLIDPASKVSVPFTVVTRTRSRVPERLTEPPPKLQTVESLRPITDILVQALPVIFETTADPCLTAAAFVELSIGSPVVLVLTVELEASDVVLPEPRYPLVVKDPDPS